MDNIQELEKSINFSLIFPNSFNFKWIANRLIMSKLISLAINRFISPGNIDELKAVIETSRIARNFP